LGKGGGGEKMFITLRGLSLWKGRKEGALRGSALIFPNSGGGGEPDFWFSGKKGEKRCPFISYSRKKKEKGRFWQIGKKEKKGLSLEGKKKSRL